MEDPNSKPEIEQNDEVAKKLADFAESEILPEWKWPPQTLMGRNLGKWYPTWKENPEEAFSFLRDTFKTVTKDFQERTGRSPVFLDLGSGDGMISASAASTGEFSNCYGIEFRAQLNSWAQDNLKKLESSGVITNDSVKLITGSYYTDKYWPAIKDKYAQRQLAQGTPQGEIDDTLRQNSDIVHALDEELLDEEGKLKADIIYWFPSDPFLPDSNEQWDEIIRPGTILVLGPSGQVMDMDKSGFFEDFEHIRDYHLEGAEHGQFADLSVYRKK